MSQKQLFPSYLNSSYLLRGRCRETNTSGDKHFENERSQHYRNTKNTIGVALLRGATQKALQH